MSLQARDQVMRTDQSGGLDLDDVDLSILERMQIDGSISNKSLAHAISLSSSACLERVHKLEAAGAPGIGIRLCVVVGEVKPRSPLPVRRPATAGREAVAMAYDAMPMRSSF